MVKFSVPVLLALLALNACAAITDGSMQTIAVKTMAGDRDVAGAQCELTNDKGAWEVMTPGSVLVRRGYGDLAIRCDHDGYIPTGGSIPSTTRQIAFGNLAFLAAAPIAAAIDVGTGSAYDYPGPVIVKLQPLR